MSEENKNFEVVAGDGSNLNISPVYEHISAERPQKNSQKPKNIVIPKQKNKKDNKEKEENADG